jgi:hypothetical protein
MFIYEIIAEAARSAKELMGHQGALTWIQQNIPEDEYGQYGVSLTKINKLGLNPQSQFDTPLGIYFYPLNYYVEQTKLGQKMPFPEDPRYIQIFRIDTDPNSVMNLSQLDDNDFEDLFERLKRMAPEILKRFPEIPLGAADLAKDIGSIEKNLEWEAKNQSPGGYLWYVLWSLSNGLLNWDSSNRRRYRRSSPAPRPSVLWNWLSRQLGVKVYQDTEGIIHGNEPVQGVVIDPSVMRLVRTFEVDNQRRLVYSPAQTLDTEISRFLDLRSQSRFSLPNEFKQYQRYLQYLKHRLQNTPDDQLTMTSWVYADNLLKIAQREFPDLLPTVVKLAENVFRDRYQDKEQFFIKQLDRIKQELGDAKTRNDLDRIRVDLKYQMSSYSGTLSWSNIAILKQNSAEVRKMIRRVDKLWAGAKQLVDEITEKMQQAPQ